MSLASVCGNILIDTMTLLYVRQIGVQEVRGSNHYWKLSHLCAYICKFRKYWCSSEWGNGRHLCQSVADRNWWFPCINTYTPFILPMSINYVWMILKTWLFNEIFFCNGLDNETGLISIKSMFDIHHSAHFDSSYNVIRYLQPKLQSFKGS